MKSEYASLSHLNCHYKLCVFVWRVSGAYKINLREGLQKNMEICHDFCRGRGQFIGITCSLINKLVLSLFEYFLIPKEFEAKMRDFSVCHKGNSTGRHP